MGVCWASWTRKRSCRADPEVGLLLPCNVVLREVGGGTRVEFADPLAMLQLMDNPDVRDVAVEAHECIDRVARALTARAEQASPNAASR